MSGGSPGVRFPPRRVFTLDRSVHEDYRPAVDKSVLHMQHGFVQLMLPLSERNPHEDGQKHCFLAAGIRFSVRLESDNSMLHMQCKTVPMRSWSLSLSG
jgi:hypothetical protein